MPLPKDPKKKLSVGQIVTLVGALAGLITSGGTVLKCADEWGDIRDAPKAAAQARATADSLSKTLDLLLDMHGDHLDANKSTWEMHTGFPMERSHPTSKDGD